MGKWTPDYTDDVLHAKISTLVSGAIRRVAVERETTTSITYENFVTDLDTGDSFTASLIDVLVKEIADRRSRTNPSDRSLLSERTVRSLRTLVSTSRTYSGRFRTHARRSVVNIPEYLSAPPPPELDMMDDDDDEFDVDVPTTIEGARLPSDLHDAYGSVPSGWAIQPSSNRRVFAGSPTPSDEWPLRSPSTTTSGRPWVAINPPSAQTSLSRQASIRRATRSRVDFNESTQRRRWSARESSALISPRPEVPESVTEPREGLVWSRPLNSQSRRFFPLPRSRRHEPSSSSAGLGVNLTTWADIDIAEGLSPDDDSFDRPVPSFWGEPLDEPPFPTDPDGSSRRFDSETRVLRVPRLRRGGVLSPESMISRHASPVIITAESTIPVTSTSATAAPVVILTPPPSDGAAEAPAIPVPASPPRPPLTREEPVAYPTPSTSEAENLA